MVELVTNKDRQHVQQHVTASVLTIIHVTTNLPTHIPKGLITNHQMEDNLETHLVEVHLEEICRKSNPSIHLLDLLDGQHLIHVCLYHHGINHLLCNLFQNQPPSYHTGSYNTQLMSKTLIQMCTS